jgi:histidyl-tRNA synthetase
MSDIKKIKPSLSKGTRDFLPREVAKRNYILNTIKDVFRKYGFEEIETPAIERLETLTGKYGDEGDKLLFKILNSGDYLKDVPTEKLQGQNARELLPLIAEKGLRYDLTVPLARYVVVYQDKLAMPFKRYHIGPVWRADRPQKGRYQEFYQCDADIIGSTSLLNEVELTKVYSEVFEQLGMDVTIRINNRKLIDEILNGANIAGNKSIVITLLDKLDKVSWDGDKGIAAQLVEIGLQQPQVDKLKEYLFDKKFTDFTTDFAGTKASEEINTTLQYLRNEPKVVFDATLMRGLDYYTGTIWEVKANNMQMGSLGGGGRYDNLTEMFGGQNMSGVGISFGIERIYDVMEELNLFPETIAQGVKVLFVPRDENVEDFAFQQTQALRHAGIPAEIYLGNVKKQKHFKYVEDKNIAYLVEVGENEKQSQLFRLRHAKTREMKDNLTLQQLIELLQ